MLVLVAVWPTVCFSNTPSFVTSADMHGFIGLGGSYNLNGDDSSQSLIESGIQLRLALPENFSFSSQLLYRDFNDETDANLKLDYASLDWDFQQWITENTLSIGRFKANGGIYSNTRDMPFTRPGIYLAGSVYDESYRSLYEHIDGIRLHSELPTQWGDFAAELGFGQSHLDDDFNSAVLAGIPENSEVDADDSLVVDIRYRTFSFLTALTYRKINGQFNVDESSFEFSEVASENSEQNQNPAPTGLLASDLDIDSYTLGMQYQYADYEFTVEGTKQWVDVSLSNQPSLTNYGYYLQGRYFVTPTIALMLRYDWQRSEYFEREAPSQDDLAEEKSQVLIEQRDSEVVSLGTVWNFDERWQLAVEGHKRLHEDTFGLVQVAWRF